MDESLIDSDFFGPYPEVVETSDPNAIQDATQGRATIRSTTWASPPVNPVPEPNSMWLLGSSMLGLASFRVIRRRRD